MTFSISDRPIDPAVLKAAMPTTAAGACVTFEGWVREMNEGRDVESLEYEAYKTVADSEGGKIMAEAMERFDIEAAHCVHRVGHLQLGDCAVWVGVSAGHRGAAFDACRYIIDEVKKRVPIWKKEHYADGDSGWINAEAAAPSAPPV